MDNSPFHGRSIFLRFGCLNVPFHQTIFIHISNVMEISHFVVINFLVIRTNFAHSLTAYVSHANIVAIGWSELELAGPNISRHRLNLNQSKTFCLKNLDSDGIIVRDMVPWPEGIVRSLLNLLCVKCILKTGVKLVPSLTPVCKCFFYLATSLSTLSMLTKVFIVKKILLRWCY